MMGIFRRKLLKCTFGLAVLAILLVKFCAYSISAFKSSAQTYAIEKSSEQNNDKEEESSVKSKKQLLHHDYFMVTYQHPEAISQLRQLTRLHQLRIGKFPPKNVPTPPPDFLS